MLLVPVNAPVNMVRMHVYCIEYDYIVPSGLFTKKNLAIKGGSGLAYTILSRGLMHVL